MIRRRRLELWLPTVSLWLTVCFVDLSSAPHAFSFSRSLAASAAHAVASLVIQVLLDLQPKSTDLELKQAAVE